MRQMRFDLFRQLRILRLTFRKTPQIHKPPLLLLITRYALIAKIRGQSGRPQNQTCATTERTQKNAPQAQLPGFLEHFGIGVGRRAKAFVAFLKGKATPSDTPQITVLPKML
jgi:hypothetical protein